MPTISVLTATHKRPWGLLAAIRCVQAQTLKNYEHIIIGDNCPDAARVVRAVDDARIVFKNLDENHDDLGFTPLNEGLKLATGEWVAVLADDNLWTKHHLARLYGAVRDKPDVGFVYGCCEVRSKRGDIANYPVFRDEPYPHWRGLDLGECLYRRSLFEKHGGWEYGGNYSADWVKIEQFIRSGEKWLHVPKCWTYVFYI